MWNSRTGELVGKPLKGHSATINSLDVGLFDNQSIVVSGSRDGTTRMWNLETGEPVGGPISVHYGAVNSVSLDRASKLKVIVSGGEDKAIRIVSIHSQQELFKIDIGSEVFSIAFNSNIGILAGISTGVILLKIELSDL
jgi:WD40 repeat protein